MSTRKVVEPALPSFVGREGDWVAEGGNNTLIVLGTDRPGDVDSGLGAAEAEGNGKRAGTIHLVAGRASSDPDFLADASFLYLSQRTDCDENLGTTGIEDSARGVPAAVLKSQNIRIGFETLKLYVGDGKYVFMDGGKLKAVFGDASVEMIDSQLLLRVGTTKVTIRGGEVSVESDADVVVRSPSVSVDAPQASFTGNVSVAGVVSAAGISAIGGNGSPGNIVAAGDVVAGPASLRTHVHPVPGVRAGSDAVVSGPVSS